ncbi:hypothetical protein M0R45_009935 [Rubus argutus]|uniref:Uncharacterized protein n=1 Tax=Rubus argutus TaxID=59490 RepID=A0AAW1Y642_RUBAR
MRCNRRTGGTAGAEFDGTDVIGNTKHLMSAVKLITECGSSLRESEVDTRAFQYVKKIKSLNVSLASANSASRSNIVDWAEKLYGQSISAVTAEVDAYLVFDPRAPKSSSGMGSNHLKGPFKEAIVFMVGGGNYVEYGSLQELVQRQQPVRHVIYGTTEILTGEEFCGAACSFGPEMGLGGAPVAAATQ